MGLRIVLGKDEPHDFETVLRRLHPYVFHPVGRCHVQPQQIAYQLHRRVLGYAWRSDQGGARDNHRLSPFESAVTVVYDRNPSWRAEA